MQAWGPSWNTRLRHTLQQLEEHHNPDWTEWELIAWLRDHQEMANSTIRKRIRHLAFMADYDPTPVQLDGSLRELVQSFTTYFQHRKAHDEDAGHGALQNDLKAVRTLGGYLGIPEDIWPKAPTAPRRHDRWLPSPEDVYELLHTQYEPNPKRNPNNALIVYMLVLDFGIGLRFPSEARLLRVDDFDPDERTLTITESKKRYSRRMVYIEPGWLANSKTHLSLSNWLRWRDKMDPDTDALFPHPDGGEWPSNAAMAQHLKRRVQPHHPWFFPYLGRHWCATARMIEWEHDYGRVAEWLGHEKADRVRTTYARQARVFEKRHGDQWLKRAWQKSAQPRAPSSAEQRGRTENPPDTAPPVGAPGGTRSGPGLIRTGDLLHVKETS